MISLKHISTLSTFNQTKFSADSTDSSYFLGSDQAQIFQGTPDVKYNDLCYIKCSNLQYTHGHLYGSTEVGGSFVKQIANLATYNGVENEIVQYVGEDTNDYKKGFFYKMTPTPTTTTTLVDVMGLEEDKGYISEGFDPYDPTAQGFWVMEKHPNFSYLTGLFTTGSKAPTGNNYATSLNPNTTYRVLAKINSNGSGGYFAYDVNDTNVYQLSTASMQIDAYANSKITVRDSIGYQYEQELTDIETITADYRVSDVTYAVGDYYTFNINFPKNANTKLVINSNMTVDSKYELMEIEYETVTEEREVTIMQLTWQQIDIQPEFDVDSIPLATTSAKGLMSANDKVLMQNINTPHIVENGTARSGLITIAEITSESIAEFIVGTMYISGVFQNGNIGGMIINMVCGNGADKTVLKSSAEGICLTDCDVSSDLNGTVYKAIVKIQLSTSCTGGFRMYYVGNGKVKWLI